MYNICDSNRNGELNSSNKIVTNFTSVCLCTYFSSLFYCIYVCSLHHIYVLITCILIQATHTCTHTRTHTDMHTHTAQHNMVVGCLQLRLQSNWIGRLLIHLLSPGSPIGNEEFTMNSPKPKWRYKGWSKFWSLSSEVTSGLENMTKPYVVSGIISNLSSTAFCSSSRVSIRESV